MNYKNLILCLTIASCCSTDVSAFKLPAAVPIHGMSIASAVSLIGIVRAKAKTYEQLRTLLLAQLQREAGQPADHTENKYQTSDIITHVRHASHKELAHIIGDIIQRRRIYEEEFGDTVLAEKLGFEQNKKEKESVNQYQQLLSRALKYEWWVPQIRAAMVGAGAASIFTVLRQLSVLD